ncbi:unnamed protein product [Bursaphelenchus xylophilus]|uniref:(pine wood nematode) hypothetical protein n=1 Tax=Bursaphelenchus xylophilus TaxID=6326 RepID=A0A1I7RIH4_BURXY|nr:unnamed protein product [Bursaphelenchus xylophilus]CAG9080756.1 unnamed protein product [Bursaphelenchus xylophilus]
MQNHSSKFVWTKVVSQSSRRHFSLLSYFRGLFSKEESATPPVEVKSSKVEEVQVREESMNASKALGAIAKLSSAPRVPSIHFLHNSRPQVPKYDPNRKPQARSATGRIIIDELELPLRLRRRPLSPEEIDCINTGGLRPSEI